MIGSMNHWMGTPLLLLWLLAVLPYSISAVTTLQPSELLEGIQQGRFDILVDVRTVEEWNLGHLENATLAVDMAQNGVELPPELLDCQMGCSIVVYCRTGNRAGVAIERMISEFGFDTNNLFNGLGVSQWTEAGYPLDFSTESTDPNCSQRDSFCVTEAEETTTATVVSSPTTSPVVSLPSVITLSADELYEGMMSDRFAVVIDVRSRAEFEVGHIPNVTLIEGLAFSGVEPTLLLENNATCLYTACHIAVTCQTGARAGVAIERLQNEYNFTNTQFYNGGGTSQWQDAGYALDTNVDSVIPDCVVRSDMATLQRIVGGGSCRSCCSQTDESDSESDNVDGTNSDTSANDIMDSSAVSSLPSVPATLKLMTATNLIFWMATSR
ncbi:rhodanese-like domain containing protein [Nitzschia inconspicua]|nr:rhodanese-like domain containing protein [Nitzschia inconspicua]